MKTISKIFALAAITLPLHAMATVSYHSSDDHHGGCGEQQCSGASWTNWTSNKSGTFSQDGETIKVSYTGNYYGNLHDASIFNDVPGSFTTSDLPNTPGANGTIKMVGGSMKAGRQTVTAWGNFHFDKPVINPLMAIWSLGQSNVLAQFVFDTDQFVILSQGAGHWGGGSLTKNGNTVDGYEGNGLIQFIGTFTDIHFLLPKFENYYGATVGAACNSAGVPNEVPLPAALPLMLTGLSLLGFGSARRAKTA